MSKQNVYIQVSPPDGMEACSHSFTEVAQSPVRPPPSAGVSKRTWYILLTSIERKAALRKSYYDHSCLQCGALDVSELQPHAKHSYGKSFCLETFVSSHLLTIFL